MPTVFSELAASMPASRRAWQVQFSEGVGSALYSQGESGWPTILALNAPAMPAAFFVPISNALDHRYSWLIPSYCGLGNSTAAPATFATLVEQMQAQLHALPGPTMLLGYSAGAKLASALLAQHTRRTDLAACMLNGAFFDGAQRTRQRFAPVLARLGKHKPVDPGLLRQILRLIEDRAERPTSALIEDLQLNWGRELAEILFRPAQNPTGQVLRLDRLNGQTQLHNYLTLISDFALKDVRPLLQNVTTPLLFIAGADDTLVDPAQSVAVSRHAARSECHLLTGATHYAPLEQPLCIARHIDTFIRTWRASAASLPIDPATQDLFVSQEP